MKTLNLLSQALVLLLLFGRPLCAVYGSFLDSPDNFDKLLLFLVHGFVVGHFSLELLFKIALVS